MKMRYEDPDNIILKDVIPPEDIYNFHIESQTMEELSNRKSPDQLIVECLVARERILGKNDLDTYTLTKHGGRTAEKKDFLLCRKIWNRVLEVELLNKEQIGRILSEHFDLFSDMIEEDNTSPDPEWMLSILSHSVQEIKRDNDRLKPNTTLSVSDIKEGIVCIIHRIFFLANTLIADVKISEDLKLEVKKLIYQLVKLNPSNMYDSKFEGYSVLHMVCDDQTSLTFATFGILYDYRRDYENNYNLVSLLLECGMDPNVRDSHNNTPLHILLKRCQDKESSEIPNNKDICELLLRSGAHIDFANDKGEIPSDYGVLLDELEPAMANRSLECLAARVIKSNNIPYKDLLHNALVQFVDKH